MCMFMVRRRTPTASTMFETWCLLHYSAIWSTLSHVKNSRFRMKDAFSIFSNKHQPDFDGEDYYSSLVTFCVFYLHSSQHPLIADFESDAPSFWGAPWIVLMSEVLFATDEGTLRSPTLRVFRGLLGLLMRLSSPVSLLTVWWFYFDLSV